MKPYRTFSKEQKREAVEETLAGQTSKAAVARKYSISHSLLLKWIEAYEYGRLDNEPTSEAGQQAKIERLEQMIGRQAMEIEFLKKAIMQSRVLAQRKERLSRSISSLSIPREGGVN